MTNTFKFPKMYEYINSLGWLTYSNYSYLWIPDIEWLDIDTIKTYKVEGLKNNCIPFAKAPNGDIWIWYCDNNDTKIGLCYHDDIEGVFYAKNIEELILKKIIEFFADTFFYIEGKEKESYQMSESKAKSILRDWINKLKDIIPKEWIDELEKIAKLSLKYCDNKEYGSYYAFLTWEEANQIINKYFSFEFQDESFIWDES